MPVLMITVEPARAMRVEFAKWAVRQTPKVRTCSPSAFAVPPGLFTHMPEALLIGSTVDGHPYRSPEEDAALAAASQWRTAVPGEPLPEVPEAAYAPDAVQLPGPEHRPAPAEAAPSEGEGAAITCDVCSRPFTTARGRDTHRRQAHPEAD
ncbi:hypothetical protein AQJ11_03165 [Streptomyces corchorusii]|uniref:C2H2-type domain-containing protein n=2 Tax=Streptomyces TaxID=1883 RepID=A0A101QMN6_STRCK|nr:hypothetical protein [Streptomyces corchorusii]KUN32541.1 hypothetical protein AQJ11_03165 [Streptomyces corchorusii]